MKIITSENNPTVKHFIKLRTNSKYRLENRSLIISGEKIVREISQHHKIKTLITTNPTQENNAVLVSEPILKKITGLLSPDGTAAEFAIPNNKAKEHKRLLVCDDIQDPGNLGTLFRTALAFDFDLVVLLPGCVDPLNDKVIRASKGSVMMLPFQKTSETELFEIKEKFGLTFFTADTKGNPLNISSFNPPFAIILGNEGHGVSKNLKKISQNISLPMKEGVNSLNVSICGSILMYLSSSLCQMK